ncbi:19605_t:CDS:10 [Funneliformis geosporum]|nr:19605_t:CDS:10 [Funneliformis geosporum]
MEKNALAVVSEQYFKTTAVDDWSYLGYLDAMKPYFYDYASIASLKSSWRKSFLAVLRSFEKCQDQERSKTATFLINEKSNKQEISEYWNRIEQERALKAKQLAVKNKTQSSALDMLNVATSNQTNQVIKLLEEEELDGPSSKNANSNPDPDASEEDQEEEEPADEIDEFAMDKGNSDKISNGVASNDSDNINFVERMEESKPMSSTCQRPWILRSGTNVGDKLTSYIKTIPEAQKCLNLAYWNILDLTDENTQMKSLFSTNDWEEMVESFNNEVKLIESDFLDVVELQKKDDKDIINAIDRLTPEIIETNRKVKLSDEEKNVISILRRTVVTYDENLERVDLPISEVDFDNAFPNMLAKRFLNREELKMDVGEIACWASAYRRNEGRSVVLRARIGQKCDFRGTLKKSINKLEALIGLRSGGLPEPHRKKIYEDKVDISVAMRDILYTFFKGNSKAPSSDIHSTFVFGIHSWDAQHPKNTLGTRKFLRTFTDLQTTLNTICEHTNSISLAHSRAHRNRKRKNPEQAGEKGGSFGNPSQSPASKKGRNMKIIKHESFLD